MPAKRGTLPKGIGAYATTEGPRFYFRYDLPHPPGTPRTQRFQRGYATPEDAETAMWEERIARRRGTFFAPSTETLEHYLRRWFTTTEKGRAPNTNLNYALAIDHVCAHLGDVPLAHLDTMMIQEAVTKLQDAYAVNTVRHDCGRLKQALAQAVGWKLLAENPCAGVTLPAATAKHITPWTAAQMAHFLRASQDDPDIALWRVLLDAGARIGEVLALSWADLDLDAGVLTIARTVTKRRDPDGTVRRYVGSEPKTESGRRVVPIRPETVAALKRHATRQKERRLLSGARWQDMNLVFDGKHGGLRWDGRVGAALRRAIAACGLPPLTPHGLRATNATVAAEHGADIKTLSQRLGHSTVQITLDRYVHPSQASSRKVSDLLNLAMEAAEMDEM